MNFSLTRPNEFWSQEVGDRDGEIGIWLLIRVMQSMAKKLGINGILSLVVILSFRLVITIFFIDLNLFIDILPGLFGVQLQLLYLKLFKLYVG